jgi:hypothetical protein
MGIKTLPPMERRLVACNPKSYRIGNTRNLAAQVAPSHVTPRPSVPAPSPAPVPPLARSPMDNAGDHGAGALACVRARARKQAASVTFQPTETEENKM